ncbi:glycerophosphodiester phosphodiesterase family protein [Aurantiacibacter spongiae]|uniref:Glycerophosphodiester phosphodiesterase n=1 Tax=Aurantiacibacter spongiae TaxID=2488860 RepID=A0A3N5DQ26_9SPHN|nr:glycerophosphodiester phosphodiesterase family protein [Aurantiacibacter spongiae]RPF71251.1 glycerophosphodiester phosphodiesterase [Aurantiacibacter spongiae]
MPRHRAPAWLSAQPYAHRGLHGGPIPENSLAAFAAAKEAGYGIECDIRVSRDGRAVVYHDEDMMRLTGREGQFDALSAAELAALRLSTTDEEGDHPIPAMRDVLDIVAGAVPLLIECKTRRDRPVHSLCRALRRDLEGYRGRVAVMSYDPRIARWFAKRMPGLPVGMVMKEENARDFAGHLHRLWELARGRPEFMAYDVRDYPSRLARSLRRLGLPLLAWTVNDGARLDVALAEGATPIMEGEGVAAWAARS